MHTNGQAVQQQITPASGESEEEFIVRAHNALASQIPDPMQRNAYVWDAWDAHHGNVVRDRAAEHFAANDYDTHPMVPLFLEHEKVNQTPDGQEIVTRYDVKELANIVRENNHRIEDTDSYTALVDKHTLPPGSDGSPQRDPDPPRTLGFVGPYRLGMIGRKEPRWAIFGDEHHRRDAAGTLRDRPRRSVEVLKLRANNRRYIDPIAALSEAPRLPLPVAHYGTGGAIVERYSFVADPTEIDHFDAGLSSFANGAMGGSGSGSVANTGGAMGGSSMPTAGMSSPGGGNTHIPTMRDTRERNDIQGDDMQLKYPADQPSVVRQAVDAITNTPEWQALQQLVAMLESQEDPGIGDAGGAPVPEAMSEEPGAGPLGPEPVPSMPPTAGAAPPVGMDAGPPVPPAADPMMRERNAAPVVPAALAALRAAGPLGQTARAAGRVAQGVQAAETIGSLPRKATGAVEGIGNKAMDTLAPGEGERQIGRTYHSANRYSTEGDSPMSEVDTDRYAALESENQALKQKLETLQADNTKLADHNRNILTEQAQAYAAMQNDVVELTKKNVDTERRERIRSLASRFPVIDVDKECERCLYSAGAEMDDTYFEQHIGTVEHYAAMAAQETRMIPAGDEPPETFGNGRSQVEQAQYAADCASTAKDIVNQTIRRGERISWPEALAQAKEKLQPAS